MFRSKAQCLTSSTNTRAAIINIEGKNNIIIHNYIYYIKSVHLNSYMCEMIDMISLGLFKSIWNPGKFKPMEPQNIYISGLYSPELN